MQAFMDPVAFKKAEVQRVEKAAADAAAAAARRAELGEAAFPSREEDVGCRFYVQVQPPWRGPRSSVASAAAKSVGREYADLKERGQEEARKIMRKKRGLLDVGEIGGLPDGFEGKVADLFSEWGAPTELTAAEKAQKEKDDKEKAEKEASEKEVRAVVIDGVQLRAKARLSPRLPLHRSFCYATSFWPSND